MEKMVFRKVMPLAFLFSLSCALEGEVRVNGEMRDVTIQRGGSCNNDNVCHNHCPGCAITRCVFNQCVCSRCNPPQQQLRDVTIQRGGSCNNDNISSGLVSAARFSTVVVRLCFWEVVAFSAPSSTAFVSGRRWLLQHRYRRLLLPGGGGFLSIASAGFLLGFSPTSIYESELHLILCLSF
uniref:Uncharacterized protein n=1 Tax=Brassica oleracea TaxID=3712 RepID=A0A3P6B0M8_BRAOL|nr:unnamed protein product [Brassica oleracea]